MIAAPTIAIEPADALDAGGPARFDGPPAGMPPVSSPCDAADWLFDAGLNPVPLGADAKGEFKRPIGDDWHLAEYTAASFRQAYHRLRARGVGVKLGPNQGPCGAWLIDLEGDGPEAEDSLRKLFDGEPPETLGWASTRGRHRLYVVGLEFIEALAAAVGKVKPGVSEHPRAYPGLEIRVGGLDDDGRLKGCQSACAPTPRSLTDATPRTWEGIPRVAPIAAHVVERLRASRPTPPPKPEPEPTPEPGPFTRHASDGRPTPEERAIQYLAKIDPAVDGQKGSIPTFRAACVIVEFGVTDPDHVYRLLRDHYNPKCVPPWSEAELRHKASSAVAKAEPGKMLRDDGKPPPRPSGNGKPVEPAAAVVDFDTAEITDRWPKLDDAAFYGLAGGVAMLAEPHTEAAPVATLVQFMSAFGCMLDCRPYYAVGATRHHLKVNVALVGATASGRKGTSWDVVEYLLGQVDRSWVDNCIQGGLVSGEGLIHHVRDDRYEDVEVKDKKTGLVTRERVLADAGVAEKRLLVVESEFSRALKAAARDSNTLSDVVRQAYDGTRLRTMGKAAPSIATGAHIAIVGHTTQSDLRKHLTANESANGFSNRFLWVLTRRSKSLPDGGDLFAVDWRPIVKAIQESVEWSHAQGPEYRLSLDPDARKTWHREYKRLTSYTDGNLSRGAPYVLRIAAVHAVLDRSTVIRREHLDAALALWAYCEASAKEIFGVKADPAEVKLLTALEAAPLGLTRSEINHKVFGRNMRADALAALVSRLLTAGEIRMEVVTTATKPAERFYTAHPTNPTP